MAIPFALQLYTVRDHLEKDFLATLKQVKAIGWVAGLRQIASRAARRQGRGRYG